MDSVDQIVIAGEGEPTLVMDKLTNLLHAVRNASATIPIRINTNGIVNDPIPLMQCASELSVGFSVSVMTEDANVYANVMNVDSSCHGLMRDFVQHAASASLDVAVTAVDRPEVDKDATQQWVTDDLGIIAGVRWRSYFP